MKKLIIVFSMLFVSVSAQQNKEQNLGKQNKESIFQLQKNDSVQDQSINQLNKIFDNVNGNNKKAEKVYETAIEMMNIKDSTFNWFMGLISVFLTLLGVTSFFGIKAYIKNKFDKMLKEREKELVEMFKKHRKESELLKDSKILIINKEETNIDEKFKMLLERFDITPQIINTLDLKVDTEGKRILDQLINYDAVILDNVGEDPDKDWNFKSNNKLKEQLIEIAKRTGQIGNAFLYFGDSNKDGRFSSEISNSDGGYLINFANKPATLFANLIDLLDYRRLIKR